LQKTKSNPIPRTNPPITFKRGGNTPPLNSNQLQDLEQSFNALSLFPKPQVEDLEQSFDALALSNPHKHLSKTRFIGGFSPAYAPYPINTLSSGSGFPPSSRPQLTSQANVSSSPGPLPRPPSMPLPHTAHSAPQTLTMQMALRPHQFEQNGFLSPNAPAVRPHSASALPIPQADYSSISAPILNYSPSQPSTPPTKPKRPRTSSTPTSSISKTTRQCAGMTKAGKQCSRQVKSGPALSRVYDNEDPAGIDKFCFQHVGELLQPSGYYARKSEQWVDFDCNPYRLLLLLCAHCLLFADWIPHYLQQDTQVALRVEMEKSRSKSDVPGYIYTFEIRGTLALLLTDFERVRWLRFELEPHAKDTIKLKVGRAVNLHKRIDQWGKQCGSKEQVLRGFYPGTDKDGAEGSLMKGRVTTGEKAAWCHRIGELRKLVRFLEIFTRLEQKGLSTWS
jgi:hypothetical protein